MLRLKILCSGFVKLSYDYDYTQNIFTKITTCQKVIGGGGLILFKIDKQIYRTFVKKNGSNGSKKADTIKCPNGHRSSISSLRISYLYMITTRCHFPSQWNFNCVQNYISCFFIVRRFPYLYN